MTAERRAIIAEERAATAEETASVLEKTAANAEERAIGAERRATSREESKRVAESRATIYEERAISAEARAALAEQRATIAEKECAITKERLSDAFKQVTVAEENATIAQRRACIAEDRATVSNKKAITDEKRANVAEERATAAEKRASVAEERANVAEMEVTAAVMKATAADTRVKGLEERTNQAEGAVKTLQESARISDIRMAELVQTNRGLEDRATRAEQQIQDLTMQCRQLQEQLDKATTPSWLVKKGDIVLMDKELGRGGWGVVQVARYCGLEVAAKLLHGKILSPHNEQLFKREMNISALVRHPNILLFIGATLDQPCVILTELMHTSLRAVLEDKVLKKVALSHQQVSTIAIDVGRALNYLHLMKPDAIIHRDVSSSNVLLDPLGGDMWKAKLSDFGSSNFARLVTTVGPGNYSYAAPESLDPSLQSPKMDVFSYGILLLEMASGQFPEMQKRLDVMKRLQWSAMKTLIEQCTARSPGDRPNIADVLGVVKKLQESAHISDIRMAELVQTNRALEDRATRAEQQIQDLTMQCRQLQEQLDKATTPSWLVKKGDIVLMDKELGRGAWGVVKVARYCGLEVAAMFFHDAILYPYNEQVFKREMNISALVRHPNILLFIGATLDQPCVILTELMHTSLRAVLEDKVLKKVTLSHQQVSTIAVDVGRALNYLHLMKPDAIIHRDVSSSNVLLDPLGGDMWKAKLSDFGSSNFERLVITMGPGNYNYAAPESLDPSLQSPKMDVFSYGILLLEMASGQFPDVQKRQDVIKWLRWSAMKTLIEQCTARSPSDRPNIADVLMKRPIA